jgi:pimeloyl-ACP methyl ester carboxylesterase
MHFAETDLLRIAYERGGPPGGRPVLLLHGWPDDVRGFNQVSAMALAQDALDLADHLGWSRFAVVGHDWGARAAYTLAALVPARLLMVGALALAYSPRGAFHTQLRTVTTVVVSMVHGY